MSASFAAWGLIVVNIVLFVPFGFLLPLGNKKFQTFWKTYLAGFLFSLTIELIQLFFHLGIFETADLLNNTIGAVSYTHLDVYKRQALWFGLYR